MSSTRQKIFLLGFLLFLVSSRLLAGIGDTDVCKWKDNKLGAYTMAFYDSLWSHPNFVAQKLINNGLTGTFGINPALARYASGINFYESLCSKYGFDLQNHALFHNGAADYAEADYEVGETQRLIWSLNPPDASKLLLFARGGSGSTYWNITDAEWSQLRTKYHFAEVGIDDGAITNQMENWTGQQMIDWAQQALDGNFMEASFHGVGPYAEWIVQDETSFDQLLDYLTHENRLWVCNYLDGHKYKWEYQIHGLSVIEVNSSLVRINLTLGQGEDHTLYNYPLTLITEVPSNWTFCRVTQGSISKKKIYPVNVWLSSATVMYEAIPGHGEIRLESSAMDTTSPSVPTVKDGLGTSDVNSTSLTTQLSANWTQSTDAESGIARYWYKIGTTPGGSQVLDWINNGMVSSVTVTRTNLSLIRGVTYYFTVKAENGVGLYSEGTSDGVCVDKILSYMRFSDDFESGNTSKWDTAGNVTVANDAAYSGNYGLKISVSGGSQSVAKNDVNNSDDAYFGFYFKLGTNFTMPDEGLLRLLYLTDENDSFVAYIHLNYYSSLFLLNCVFGSDWNSLPSYLTSISPGTLPHIEKNTWYKVDLHVRANNGDGGVGIELWLNGKKEGSLRIYVSAGSIAAVRNASIGVLNISDATGDIYIDDVTVSDSLCVSYAESVEDTTPPIAPGLVRDGTGTDISSTTSNTQLSANWTAAADPESMVSYKYAIGTNAGGTNVLGWTANSGTSVTKTGTFTVGQTYYFSVKAVSSGGESAAANSNGQMVEVGPNNNLALGKAAAASSLEDTAYAAGNAVDGNTGTRWSSLETDLEWIYVDLGSTSNVDRVVLKWEAAYGRSYEIQVSANAVDWTQAYATTSGDGGTDDISFSAVSTRYVRMYGTQRGRPYCYSLWEFEVYGNTETQDTTPPSAPEAVNDGTGADVYLTISTTQLSANWTAATDGESGIVKYQYAIGTTAGGTSIVGWTDNGTNLTATKTGLTLTVGQTYYFSVRAVNGAVTPLTGPATNSNGQYVVEITTPPPHLQPAEGINAYPNPCDFKEGRVIKFAVSNSEIKEVKIYTMKGILVKTLTTSEDNVEWDGKNEDGEKAVKGIYIYKIIETNGGSITGKLAIR